MGAASLYRSCLNKIIKTGLSAGNSVFLIKMYLAAFINSWDKKYRCDTFSRFWKNNLN